MIFKNRDRTFCILIHIAFGIDGGDSTFFNPEYVIGQMLSFLQTVGHMQRGDAGLISHMGKQLIHLSTCSIVQSTQRLIQAECLGVK